VFLFDEACIGKINKANFFDCLQSYGIFKEKLKAQPLSLDHKVFFKFYNSIKAKSLSPEQAFLKADNGSKGFLLAGDLQILNKKLTGENLLEREVRSIMNILDVDLTGRVKKNHFMRELHRARQALSGHAQALFLSPEFLEDEEDQRGERPMIMNLNGMKHLYV
jgi:hypothetical protein